MDSKIKKSIILFFRYYFYRSRCFYELLFPYSGLNNKNSQNVVATPFMLIFINIVLIIVFIFNKFNIEIKLIENKKDNSVLIFFFILLLCGIYIHLYNKFIEKHVSDNFYKYKHNYENEEVTERRKNGWLLIGYQIFHILITGIQMVLFVKYI